MRAPPGRSPALRSGPVRGLGCPPAPGGAAAASRATPGRQRPELRRPSPVTLVSSLTSPGPRLSPRDATRRQSALSGKPGVRASTPPGQGESEPWPPLSETSPPGAQQGAPLDGPIRVLGRGPRRRGIPGSSPSTRGPPRTAVARGTASDAPAAAVEATRGGGSRGARGTPVGPASVGKGVLGSRDRSRWEAPAGAEAETARQAGTPSEGGGTAEQGAWI